MTGKNALIKWGWLRVILYIVIALCALLAVQYFRLPFSNLLPTEELQSLNSLYALLLTNISSSLIILFITYLFVRFIDRTYFKDVGLRFATYKQEAAIGFFVAVFLICGGTLIMMATGFLTLPSIQFNSSVLIVQLLLMVFVALTEELMFRGYILGNLMQSMNKWVALFISSSIFGLVHIANPEIGFIPVLNIILAGLLLGINYVYTKNLWYSIGLHFSWNFLQGPILGYDVSGNKMQGFFTQAKTGPAYITGGEFGFEGSVICTALLIISTLILYYIFQKRYIATVV